MTTRQPNRGIFGVGNALMDFEYLVDDGFLRDEKIAKGHMTLVDEAGMAALEAKLAASQFANRLSMSGGSAANAVFAARGFGASGFYACRVGEDDAGKRFLADLAGAGIGTSGRRGGGATGRCLTLVTADAERTLITCLGVSAQLAPQDVDEAAVDAAAYVYVEGYLASAAAASDAAVLAREVGAGAGARTSLSLSDPSMVLAFRDGLEKMLGNGVHQLFCNEEEALVWTGTDRLDIAIRELTDIARFVNVTVGARGSLTASKNASRMVPGYPSQAVDTTGAGDIYAGACLHALTEGAAPPEAARFANFAAAALVAQHGARLRGVADYAALRRRFRP